MYSPNPAPADPAALSAYVQRELTRLAQYLQSAQDWALLRTLHASPTKVLGGMLVRADGTDWQPDGVHGEGLYERNAANSTWKFLG